ncbi:50S ribosomal protein L17 [Candidatus Peregrinibacteria bacterium CG1_02_41_10]|nr:MAG: 50S ribosomal protein L17 [Candidatus Peregrinibacteria bacterium CG1_02_41_10]
MRHRKKKILLSRDKDHRKMLWRNLATSLILYERIKTTSTKARFVKPRIERMITIVKKKDKMNAIRYLEARLLDSNASRKLMEVLLPLFKDRKGGYTRTIKIGPRSGDAAPMVYLELVK